MSAIEICDFLSPALTADGITGRYVEVRSARKLEPDIQDRDAELPLALVHPWKETAGRNRYDNFVSQRVDEQFAVITVCPLAILKDCRKLLFSAALGKVMPYTEHEILYVSGETLDLDASVIWWRDIFTVGKEWRQT